LQAYVYEFVFRFNRRFWAMAVFDSLLGIAADTMAPTYEGLYGKTWTHPGAWQE
jgi:hypothetical protein